jgi:hypothetical protein
MERKESYTFEEVTQIARDAYRLGQTVVKYTHRELIDADEATHKKT